ncbi:MAG: hypothetical protein R2762_28345 [Bryobacteraceae bacterium]
MYGRILAITAGALVLSLPAAADSWNKKTILTVKQAVLIPGKTLQPGKYVVKLVDSLSDRHIVQITNEAEDEVITTVLAIPNYRLQPTGRSQFEWWETPVGNPPALRAWFYPGDNFGQEFAYPKGLSAKIAERTHVSVPTVSTEKPEELSKAPLTVVEPSGVEKPPAVETYAPPVRKPVQVAEARPPEPAPLASSPAPTAQVEAAPMPPAMPDTASPYPLIALAGLAALAAGLLLRFAIPARR